MTAWGRLRGRQRPLKVEAAADYLQQVHAACACLIAYRTAYLKANYPAEYMAAVISSVMSTKDKVPSWISRCADMASTCSGL
jgi:DNA polymerase-3 subunit alpha